jgi:hypothetical protein
MHRTETLVSVYYFRSPVEGSEIPATSSFKATRAAIEGHFGGVALEGTEEQVSADALDELGCYVNAPSSWTDLS